MKPEPLEPQPPSITAEEIFEKWIDARRNCGESEDGLVIDAIRFTMEEVKGG